jgi:hypothetical protein
MPPCGLEPLIDRYRGTIQSMPEMDELDRLATTAHFSEP